MKELVHILFLEDAAEDFVLVNHALAQSGLSFESKQVETEESFVSELQDHRPDVILLDHGLNNFDAFSSLALAKEKAPATPLIFVTGSLGEEAAAQAIKSGAADYVLKTHLDQLAPAINRVLSRTNGHMAQLREAEERIRELNAQLEARVIQRTAELEAANRELEAFSYSVSHDLRAPLRHIDGFVRLLQQSAGHRLDEHSREYLDVIATSAHQMGKLIDALLSFSRMGRAALSRSRVDLARLVHSVVEDFRYDAEGRQIEWGQGELPEVFGDESLLRIVLFNLLSNALKYTRSQPISRIEIGSRHEPRETIVFVRDNGIGFDPKHAGKLFGVFQRLHAASEFEGIGIGLANVRRIIQRHGGRTWAESTPGRGATFYFSLPRAETVERQEDPTK